MNRQSQKWIVSERNARYCLTHGLPYEMFLCVVGDEYKQLIWQEMIAKLGLDKTT